MKGDDQESVSPSPPPMGPGAGQRHRPVSDYE
jgi:hypothetical protein